MNNFISIIDNKVYTDANTYQILKRFSYLGNIKVCATLCPNTKKVYSKINTEVDFLSPDKIVYVDKARMFTNYRTLKIIKKEVIKCDLVVGYQSPCVNAETALYYAKKYGKKYMSYMVACVWDGLWNHGILGKICAPYRFLSLKLVTKYSDYVLYVTNEFLQKRYKNQRLCVGCSDVVIKMNEENVLYNRLHKIDSRKEDDIIKLVTVAAVDVKYKGQGYVIKALSRLKQMGLNNIHYYLVGGGSQDYLLKLARMYNIESNVHFMGVIPHDDIPAFHDKMDVYIQPSLQEGLPRSVVEAMSRGLLCIGTRTAGTPELLQEDYIVEKKSVDGIVGLLKKISKEELILQAKRNYNEAKKYQETVLSEKRNAFFDKIIKDITE